MPFRTTQVSEPPDPSDGFRLLVMCLWPRGVRQESIHAWERDLGPSPALLKAYRSGHLPWEEFARRYEEEIRARPDLLQRVRDLERAHGTVTLLCACPREDLCHRSLLRHLLEEAS